MRETIGNLTVEDMIKALRESISFEEVFVKLGVSGGTNNRKKVKFVCEKYQVDIAHFDKHWYSKRVQIHQNIDRVCLWCGVVFTTQSGGKDSHKCCSQTCANRFRAHPFATQEKKDEINKGKEKIAIERKLKPTPIPKRQPTPIISRNCETCGVVFTTKKKVQPTCGRKCGTEISRRKMLERIKNGLHKGWATRPNLSYPEKFFIEVLKNNLPNEKVLVNHPITKHSLGIKCSACYFLDFYFPDFKLDLEIDGRQHEREDRKASDAARTAALESNGYIVYRIKWKNPKFDSEYIKEEIRKFLEFFDELKSKFK